jgi:hypothetical protein
MDRDYVLMDCICTRQSTSGLIQDHTRLITMEFHIGEGIKGFKLSSGLIIHQANARVEAKQGNFSFA